MGQKKDDGDAVDVTVPAGAFETEELYRIDNFSGILTNAVLAADTVRTRSMQLKGNWYFKTPVGIGVTRGAYLFWTAGAGTKVGATDLGNAAGTAGDRPVAKVEEVRDANGYVGAILLHAGGSIA